MSNLNTFIKQSWKLWLLQKGKKKEIKGIWVWKGRHKIFTDEMTKYKANPQKSSYKKTTTNPPKVN